MKSSRIAASLFFLALGGGPSVAHACWELAEKQTGVDRYLLKAVVDVESGGRPQALAVAKRGVWLRKQPDSISQAISWATWLDQNGYTFAVGTTQINWRAHGSRLMKQGISLQRLYCDVCLQLVEGAKILRNGFDSVGVNWEGVGAYYTGGGKGYLPWERYRYAQKVFSRYQIYKSSPPLLTVPEVNDLACK
ncbi:transglycosylase SLT domain-containing protein [Chromobacterium vaccinii]|uniref:transglycosylase SLT domain-containing protein n=1 Tax=Chromobacterium vaccinii TaxID=1108595 RepID=UPI00345974E4